MEVIRKIGAILGLVLTLSLAACSEKEEFSQERYDAGVAEVEQKLLTALTEYLPEHHPDLAEELRVSNSNNYDVRPFGTDLIPKTYHPNTPGGEEQFNYSGYGIYRVDVLGDCDIQVGYSVDFGWTGPEDDRIVWGAVDDTENGNEKVWIDETLMYGEDAYKRSDFWELASNYCLAA